MAAVISIVNKPAFPALQNPKSWWQTLPQNPPKGKDKVKTEKFNLLVYLKDLDRAQPGGGKEQKEAAKKIHIVNNAKLTAILHNLIQLGYEYHLDNQKSITAMVPIEGNEEARLVVEEHESLIRLGRTAYDDPNNLKDYIGPGFFAHFNQGLLSDDRGKSDTLDRALNWVDNWAQVSMERASPLLKSPFAVTGALSLILHHNITSLSLSRPGREFPRPRTVNRIR